MPTPFTSTLLDIIKSHFPNEQAEVLVIIQKFLQNFEKQGQWEVEDYSFQLVEQGHLVEITVIGSDTQVLIPFGDPNLVSLAISINGVPNQNKLLFKLLLGSDEEGVFIEIQDFTFGLKIKGLNNAAGVEFTYQDSFRLYPGLQLHADFFDDFQLPKPFPIVGQGLNVEATGMAFDLFSGSSIPAIEAMGLPKSFIGIYFREVLLQVAKNYFFDGFPNLNLELSDFALGPSGISFNFYELFDVDACLNNPNEGYLISKSLKLCFESFELKIRDNSVDAFSINSILRLPFLKNLDLALKIEASTKLGSDDLSFDFSIERYGEGKIELESDKLPFKLPASDLKIKGKVVKLTASNLPEQYNLPSGFTGLAIPQAELVIPSLAGTQFQISNAGINGDGFTGIIKSTFPLEYKAEGHQFDGPLSFNSSFFGFGISSVELSLKKNVPAKDTRFSGQIYLPIFDDPLIFTIGVDTAGNYTYEVDGIDGFYFDEHCIAFNVDEKEWARLVNKLVPGFFETLPAANGLVTVRILRDGTSIKEIRADVEIPKTSFDIPGVSIDLPASTMHLILTNTSSNGIFPHKVKIASSLNANDKINGRSNLSWMRDDLREVNNDEKQLEKQKDPLLGIALTSKAEQSIVLIDFDTKELKFPSFLKHYNTGLGRLDINDTTQLCLPSPDDTESIKSEWFGVEVSTGFIDELFKLPFLRNDPKAESSNFLEQFISVKKGGNEPFIDFAKSEFKVPLLLTVKVGALNFPADINLGFNWERFAFNVDHGEGIKLLLDEPDLVVKDFMGLDWYFKGKETTHNNQKKYHFLTLATQNYHYQIRLAEGAEVELQFTKLSKEPIGFRVSDFAVSEKGIDLKAEVIDKPVRLNGINTRFKFEGTRIEIRENRIQEFTLRGSGPLPPDLVGEAMVDISLQFAQQNGNLTLVAGGARLQLNKPLEAKNIRFKFRIDSIGLAFIFDGSFHLYFTISGSAKFTPIDNDDNTGPLGLLSKVSIDFLDCPLTGDASVLAKHIKFQLELPRKVSFAFLGCFEMELRGIGFIPQSEAFNGDAALLISGQVFFSAGADDIVSAKFDFHNLYIGIPERGSFIPRFSMERMGLELAVAGAFRLAGVVSFVNNDTISGFSGEGMIEIRALPSIAASFSFLRVRRDPNEAWLRAWFIYLEARRISLEIPIIRIFIREIGLGFGYRYTIASIKASDNNNDIKSLIKELQKLSLTQGNLTKLDSWAVDIEEKGGDPRWTIVFRAMIAQNSVSAPLIYNDSLEPSIPCIFLFDALIAFRSDFTFYMGVRTWYNTNYHDFLTNEDVKNKPLFTGYVLLSPRKKRFLANLKSSPEGGVGSHPDLPDFIKKAIEGIDFSVFLLIEPGLFHYEMGWPNNLGYSIQIGPLFAEVRTGFLFRISRQEIVLGQSLYVRGALEIDYGISLGIVGVRVYARADVAYGARYIGVMALSNPISNSAVYGQVGLDLRITFSVNFWIKIDLGFFDITLSISFSFFIGFSASLEVGLKGTSPGVRGRGTISVGAFGRSVRLNIHVGLNESAVTEALDRTSKYLNMGLEGGDVKEAGSLNTQNLPQPRALQLAASRAQDLSIHQPDYNIFVVRKKIGDYYYFALIPSGEKADEVGVEEPGFLPVPPKNDNVAGDFSLKFSPGVDIERFDPFSTGSTKIPFVPCESEVPWRANWAAEIIKSEDVKAYEPTLDEAGNKKPMEKTAAESRIPNTLKKYLGLAFVQKEGDQGPEYVDPPTLAAPEKIKDSRVQNPTESAYEAAVKGAIEQFQSSPFFKNDPDLEYDRLLNEAYKDTTTVYESVEDQGTSDAHEQADQLRGMIIQDFIRNLQNYATHLQTADTADPKSYTPEFIEKSVAFQMGLVFRVKGAPEWLDKVDTGIKIKQRKGETSTSADAEERDVRTFNLSSTDFSINPPSFQDERVFSDTNMIAIAWDLVWNNLEITDQCTACQLDPEHHLDYYKVVRSTIDNSEPTIEFSVKNGSVLVKDGPLGLKALQPRFQIVDHFTKESLAAQAALPKEGRTYIYNITPVDFSGALGRLRSIEVTRYPNLPPLVPVDGVLSVIYEIGENLLNVENVTEASQPALVSPKTLQVTWTEPSARREEVDVPIDTYRLIFRKESILPTGFYGADAATQEAKHKNLPSSNARPLTTDIKIELKNIVQTPGSQNPKARIATIPLEDLQTAGVFPEDGQWEPEAWKVFFQTESKNKVPSSIIPLNIELRAQVPHSTEDRTGEERLLGHLEWLPKPIQFELLAPEDLLAYTGMAHFPMLKLHGSRATDYQIKTGESTQDVLNKMAFQEHPAGIRAVRFFWNQGPSAIPDYPLSINASYDLLELDVDAYSTEVFADKELLKRAVKRIQELRLASSEELYLIPSDTFSTNQWEAWYPSTLLRLRDIEKDMTVKGSETAFSPWYSWRDSILVWPKYLGLGIDTSKGNKNLFFHPVLYSIVAYLESLDGPNQLPLYIVDLQVPPPLQAMDRERFFALTSPEIDPYGWGILQRMGLSMTISIRDAQTGALITADQEGENLLSILKDAIYALQDQENLDKLPSKLVQGQTAVALKSEDYQEALKHLHVELLFQPDKRVELNPEIASPSQLLGIVQLSLRPVVEQRYKYAQISIEGAANTLVNMVLFNTEGCTIINQQEAAGGEIHFNDDPKQSGNDDAVNGSLNLPGNGFARLLMRAKVGNKASVSFGLEFTLTDVYDFEILKAQIGEINTVDQHPLKNLLSVQRLNATSPIILMVKSISLFDQSAKAEIDLKNDSLGALLQSKDKYILTVKIKREEVFGPTDERSTYFSIPPKLREDFENTNEGENVQWKTFKTYAEAQNSPDKSAAKIEIPLNGKALDDLFPLYLIWAQRFMDHTTFIDKNQTAQIEAGPWLVSAYPKVNTPSFAAPDRGGRIKYDHLLSDQWAHNYRYYVRPSGRYDALWDSFRQSPVLLPNQSEYTLLSKASPEPDNPNNPSSNIGGLDVVLDRTKAISAPVIIASTRLDEESTSAQPAAPGRIWEVIVAQHPEQILMEKNVTIYRRLSYRQQAFSLLRRFNEKFLNYPNQFNKTLAKYDLRTVDFDFEYVENIMPAIPEQLPSNPEHIDFSALTSDESLALSVPQRIGRFSQSAMVLHFESLPFYYEQKLLIIAQTATTVSSVNSITQQDFHYQTPPAVAILGYLPLSYILRIGTPLDKDHRPYLLIPLQRLWDAMSPAGQTHWPEENPATATEGKWRLGALPDLSTVYQIVEIYGGNVEVQAEYFFEPEKITWEKRKLGKKFDPLPVDTIRKIKDPRQEQFMLVVPFNLSKNVVNVVRNYSNVNIHGAKTRAKVSYQANPGRFEVSYWLSEEDVDNILWNSVPDLEKIKVTVFRDTSNLTPKQIRDFLAEWYSSRWIEGQLNRLDLPVLLLEKLEFPQTPKANEFPVLLQSKLHIEGNTLVWVGDAAPRYFNVAKAYQTLLPGNSPFQLALEKILKQLEQPRTFEADYEPLSDVWAGVDKPNAFNTSILQNQDNKTIWTLSWIGPMTLAELEVLKALDPDAPFQQGVQSLYDTIDQSTSVLIIRHDSIIEKPAAAPDRLSIESIAIVDDPGSFEVAFKWQGPITAEEINILRGLSTDEVFVIVMETLIAQIPANIRQTIAKKDIKMTWPLFDLKVLERAAGIDLEGLVLEVDAGKLRWTRELAHLQSITEIRSKIATLLHSKDPLLLSFNTIAAQIEQNEIEVPLNEGSQLLRLRKPLTEGELAVLLKNNPKNESVLRRLNEDLLDQAALHAASAAATCTVFLSTLPSNLPILQGDTLVVDHPQSVQLVLFGIDDSGLELIKADQAFKAGVQQLQEQLNAQTLSIPVQFKRTKRFAKDLENLGLSAQLDQAGKFYTHLSWKGGLRPQQRERLLAYSDDPDYLFAIHQLLALVDQSIQKVNIPTPIAVYPIVLEEKLQLIRSDFGTSGLTWQGPILDVQAAPLAEWSKNLPEVKPAVDNLIQHLSNAEVVVELNAPLVFTEWLNLFNPFVSLSEGELRWRGLYAIPSSTFALLQTLQTEGDAEFQRVITALLGKIENFSVQVDFAQVVLDRPETKDLELALQRNFLIGNVQFNYFGVMPLSDAKALMAILRTGSDLKSLQELYECSQRLLISNRDIRIRTRRGAAKPSEMKPFSYLSIEKENRSGL